MALRIIVGALWWLVGLLVDTLKWAFAVSVIGFCFGFWQFIGWDGARTLVPFVLESLGR